MKICFIQIFDTKATALTALGEIETALPDHTHKLDEAHNQVQLYTNIKGQENQASYGDFDNKSIFVVTSTAP